MDTPTATTDALTSESSALDHHHRRRKIEMLLLGLVLAVTVVFSWLVLTDMRWRWRHFKAEWF